MSRATELRLLERTGTLFAQLFFIAAGVYLGNRADSWKEERSHRQAARATLENFRTELRANRDAVREALPVHTAYLDSMSVSERRGDPPPKSVREVFRRVGWHGLNPVSFQHTAWDLALATQALSYVPAPLAFRIARVYTFQQRLDEFQRGAGMALFNPASLDDAHVFPFLFTLGAYLEDSRLQEPQLIAAYDRMIPRIDSALAASPK